VRKAFSAYEVHPYSLDALIQLTATLSGQNTPQEIRAKTQPAYLHEYFQHADIRTIVVEREYVDRDYLEDFAAYYVRCFERYERTCSRLHFFSTAFDGKRFRQILGLALSDPAMRAFRESYCGFIVIKPLPQTVFGRTCLRTYPPKPNRHFPIARKFTANLFGIALDIPETLPFQEQDSVVAACATSALWSVLQATAKEFQHRLWTPIEITQAATEFSPVESRMIPNRGGLSTAMMAEAIRSVGLEPLLLDVPENDDDALRAAIYAYIRARIPVIMGVALVDICARKRPRLIGLHAVAVTGYNLSGKPARSGKKTGFRQRATCIDKIYVHDDQLGPFARMTFDGVRVKQPPESKGDPTPSLRSLSTTWKSSDGTLRVRAIPQILLVPLYHKIRIPYADVFQAVIELDGFLKTLTLPKQHSALGDLEWDLHLTTVNDLKTDLQASSELRGTNRTRWLTKSMARFVWRATAYAHDRPIFDVLIDATDIHTSNGVHGVIFYDAALEAIMNLIATSPALWSISDLGAGARRILEGIADGAAAAAA
jgi:hypothetical protein